LPRGKNSKAGASFIGSATLTVQTTQELYSSEGRRDCGQWTDFNYITDPLRISSLTHPHSAVPTRVNLALPGKHVLTRPVKYIHSLWSALTDVQSYLA
jgi:hypothetical protein